MENFSKSKTDLWEKAFSQVEEIRVMPEDWDGAGAPVISPAVIDTALVFLRHKMDSAYENPPSWVVASPSGCVCVEWRQPGLYMDAEIGTGEISWMFKEENKPYKHVFVSKSKIEFFSYGKIDFSESKMVKLIHKSRLGQFFRKAKWIS